MREVNNVIHKKAGRIAWRNHFAYVIIIVSKRHNTCTVYLPHFDYITEDATITTFLIRSFAFFPMTSLLLKWESGITISSTNPSISGDLRCSDRLDKCLVCPQVQWKGAACWMLALDPHCISFFQHVRYFPRSWLLSFPRQIVKNCSVGSRRTHIHTTGVPTYSIPASWRDAGSYCVLPPFLHHPFPFHLRLPAMSNVQSDC